MSTIQRFRQQHKQISKAGGGGIVFSTEKAFQDAGGVTAHANSPVWIGGTPYWCYTSHKKALTAVNKALTLSADAVASDDGSLFINSTEDNLTLTVDAGMPTGFGFTAIQASTGTVTVAAGDDVTFIGATLATTLASDMVAVINIASDTYVIKAI